MQVLKIPLITLCLCFSALFVPTITSSQVMAETLVIKNTDQFYSDNKPYRGMSKDQVRRHFGEPRQLFAAVGDPPISRWQYEAFTVYFEHSRVIHAVDNYYSRNRR